VLRASDYVYTSKIVIYCVVPRDENGYMMWMPKLDPFFKTVIELYHAESVEWVSSGLYAITFRWRPNERRERTRWQLEEMVAELFQHYVLYPDGEHIEWEESALEQECAGRDCVSFSTTECDTCKKRRRSDD